MLTAATQISQTLLRPYRTPVDLETVFLLLVLLLVIAGGWHLVLERIDL